MQLRVTSPIAFIGTLILCGSLLSCATSPLEGDVMKIQDNQITIRQDDGSFMDVSVKNRQDVRILDTVVIKDHKAIVKDRLLDDDFCTSRSCHF